MKFEGGLYSMNTYGLEKYGITDIKEVVYNPSYEQLSTPAVPPKINISLWTITPRTLYGGLPTSLKMTTIP